MRSKMTFKNLLKRVSSIVLVAVLLVAASYTGVVANAASAKGNYVFNHGADANVVQTAIGSDNYLVAYTVATNSPFGDALKLSQGKGGSAGWARVPFGNYDSGFALSEAAGIAFYAEIPVELSQSKLKLAITNDAWTSYWTTTTANVTYATYEDGVVTTETVSGKYPLEGKAGFKGFVFVPFTAFSGLSLSSINATKTWSVAFNLSANSVAVDNYLVDEIGFYGDVNAYVQRAYDIAEGNNNAIGYNGDINKAVKGYESGVHNFYSANFNTSSFMGTVSRITPSVGYGKGYFRLPLDITTNIDFKSTKGIGMFVDFSEKASKQRIILRLINDSGTGWNYKEGSEITLVGLDGRVETSTLQMSDALVGFTGFVFIPYTSFNSTQADIDVSKLNATAWNLDITYWCDTGAGAYTDPNMYYDCVGFYSDEQEYIKLARKEGSGISINVTDDHYLFVEDKNVTAATLIKAIGKPVYADYSGFDEDTLKIFDENGNEVASDAIITTGMTVEFRKYGTLKKKLTIAVEDDYNCDGITDVRDFVRLKRAMAGAVDYSDAVVRAIALERRTIGQFGNLSAVDMTNIKREVMGIATEKGKPAEAKKGFEMVKNGASDVRIVIDNSNGISQSVAYDLQTKIFEMTGVKLPVVDADSKLSGKLILVGESSLSKELGFAAPKGTFENEGYRIYADSEILALIGNDENGFTGSQFAVNEILNDLGFGWYGLLSIWNVTPSAETVVIDPENTASIADFGSRQTPTFKKHYGLGMRWNLGGYGSEINHKPEYLFPPSEYYPAYSQYYAYASDDGTGTMSRNPNNKQYFQLCYSNKEVQSLTAEKAAAFFKNNPNFKGFALGQHDGVGDSANWCECAACKAYGSDPGETMMRFVNDVAAILKSTHPEYADKTLMFYGYFETFEAPTYSSHRADSMNMMTLCAQDGHGKIITEKGTVPMRPEQWDYMIDAIQYWRSLGFKRMSIYEWMCPGASWNGAQWVDSMWIQGDVIIENYRYYAREGIDFVHIDGGPNKVYDISETCYDLRWPLWYINNAALYDSSKNLDDLLLDACNKLYSSAGKQMYEFYKVLIKAMKNSPVNSSDYATWHMPTVNSTYSAYVAEADARLAEAMKVATALGGNVYTRVQSQQYNWNVTKGNF